MMMVMMGVMVMMIMAGRRYDGRDAVCFFFALIAVSGFLCCG